MEEKKRSYYNCSVDGCLNSTLNCDLSFFNLPLNSERRTEWLRFIHREDLIHSSCFRTRVCEAHFRPNCILSHSNRKSLKKTSIPQLLLPLPKNFANKGIQAIFETADANVQCDYDFQTNSRVRTPLQLSKDISRKRKPLSEAKVANPSRIVERRRGEIMPVTEQSSNSSISNIILDLETPRDPNEDSQLIYDKQPVTFETNSTKDPLISTNTTSTHQLANNHLDTNEKTATDHIPTSDLMKFLLEQKNKERRDEDIDTFFKSIAATVKKFTERHQAIIKNSVFECVSEIEMKEIDEKEQQHNEVTDTRHNQLEEPEQFVRCDLCNTAITGFVYACVQCSERACGACDAQRHHTRHHVMRAPCGSNENDVEAIVSKVREALSTTSMRPCDAFPDDTSPTPDSDENGYAEIKIEVDEGDLQTAYEDLAAGAASQIVPEGVEVKIEASDPLADPPPTKKRKTGDPPAYPNRSTKEDQDTVKQEPLD